MRNQSGQAMVEFSLILPVLAVIFLFAGAITILTIEAVRYGTLVRNELMDWERDRSHSLRQSVMVNRTPYAPGHTFGSTWVELIYPLQFQSTADPCVRFASAQFSVSVGYGRSCMTPVFFATPTPAQTPKITITITRRVTPPRPTLTITPTARGPTPTPTLMPPSPTKVTMTPSPINPFPTRSFPGP